MMPFFQAWELWEVLFWVVSEDENIPSSESLTAVNRAGERTATIGTITMMIIEGAGSRAIISPRLGGWFPSVFSVC